MLVRICEDRRTIFVKPEDVVAVIAGIPEQDPLVKGRWVAKIDILLRSGQEVRVFIEAEDDDVVLEKTQELIDALFFSALEEQRIVILC